MFVRPKNLTICSFQHLLFRETMAGRQLHGGGWRVFNVATSQVPNTFVQCVYELNPVWQGSTSWKQFALDQTLGTSEGRKRLYEEKLMSNWMNQEEATVTLSHIGKTSISYCRFLVCNNQLIFCGGVEGTEVFNMSGEKIRMLTEEYTITAAVGKETFAAVMGESHKTITLWSTKGDMAQLHSFQLVECAGHGIQVMESNGAGDKFIINTRNNIIVIEMGETGEWENKTLATFSEPATHYMAGQGNWIAVASFPWKEDPAGATTVALWHQDKRFPDVILPICKRDGHEKFLTGITIESSMMMDCPKLVVSVDEVDDEECSSNSLGNDGVQYGAQQDCRRKDQLGPD